jgi:hypothetical protein
MALLFRKCTYPDVRRKKKARDGGSLSDLCHSCGVASCRWLVGISSSKRHKPHTRFRVVNTMVHLPSCLVVGMWDQPPFVASVALHSPVGQKAEAPRMPHIILGVGSELSLWFAFLV